MSFSLYVHIPWCQSKCPYCDFNSYAAADWPEAQYTRALTTELRHRVEQAPWSGQSLSTIFFGGGTPSLFKPGSIAAVIEAADRWCGIDSGAEITLEANPGTVDLAKLRDFRDAGVNRISFGAQSFNSSILKFLGRIHTADQTRRAAEDAHRAGFERLNLDLIFAVPGQTLDDVRDDIRNAAALGPDHISAYNLTFEEGTAFFGEMRRGRIHPLSDESQASMYAMVREEIPAHGYPMYEISNYAARSHESRHNLAYWRGSCYLGLGAGAHSFANPTRARIPIGRPVHEDGSAQPPASKRPEGEHVSRRWWNERNPARYIARVEHDGVAEAGAEDLDQRTAAGEFVFLHLRLREGLRLSDFEARFGRGFDQVFGLQAARLIDARLLLRAHGRIWLSDRGLELADSVFAEFV